MYQNFALDWRDEGAVNIVKRQRHCGSCYAFGAVGAIESHHFIKTGIMISLSEQNLIDCSQAYGNHGCHGGSPKSAFKYIHDNGICTEEAYPYIAHENSYCKPYVPKSNVTVQGFTALPRGDEEELQKSLARYGPIAVSIDAHHQSFHHYKGGLWYEPNCSSDHLHHSVLLVGYGTDEYGRDYYTVKNSWGTVYLENS